MQSGQATRPRSCGLWAVELDSSLCGLELEFTPFATALCRDASPALSALDLKVACASCPLLPSWWEE